MWLLNNSDAVKRKPGANQRGFTLVELVLMVFVLGLLIAGSSTFGYSFLARNALKNDTSEIISSLRAAQLNSISSKGGSNWGVNLSGSVITLFMGDSFATRNTAFDETFDISSYVSVSGFEIVFNELTGMPQTTMIIPLTNDLGDTNTISVNDMGIVNVN